MLDKRKLEFSYGNPDKTLEEQANKQGYTLGKISGRFEALNVAQGYLYAKGYISKRQHLKICKKIQRNILKAIKPLKGKAPKVGSAVSEEVKSNGKSEEVNPMWKQEIMERFTEVE